MLTGVACFNLYSISSPVVVTDAGASPPTEMAYVITITPLLKFADVARVPSRRRTTSTDTSMSTYLDGTPVTFAMPCLTAMCALGLFTKLSTSETAVGMEPLTLKALRHLQWARSLNSLTHCCSLRSAQRESFPKHFPETPDVNKELFHRQSEPWAVRRLQVA